MSTFLDQNVNDLVLQLDPDYIQCDKCKKLFHKKVMFYFLDADTCPLCLLKEDEGKEIPIKTLEETMKDFDKEYQNNPNFLTIEQNKK